MLYCRQIYYYETDRMSIVHNSNYLRIFEEARLYHLAQCGIDYFQMEQTGILIPQNEAYVKYMKPLEYGDRIRVDVKLVKFNGIIMKYEYNIYVNDEEKPAASGFTCHCFIDDKTRLPLNIKKRSAEIYESMIQSIKTD